VHRYLTAYHAQVKQMGASLGVPTLGCPEPLRADLAAVLAKRLAAWMKQAGSSSTDNALLGAASLMAASDGTLLAIAWWRKRKAPRDATAAQRDETQRDGAQRDETPPAAQRNEERRWTGLR